MMTGSLLDARPELASQRNFQMTEILQNVRNGESGRGLWHVIACLLMFAL